MRNDVAGALKGMVRLTDKRMEHDREIEPMTLANMRLSHRSKSSSANPGLLLRRAKAYGARTS